MKVLVYAAEAERSAHLFQCMIEVIETQAMEGGVETYWTMSSFARMLRQPKSDVAVAVLLAATKEELSEILSIKDLMLNLRIILILGDAEEDTIAKGHKLRPRFLTYSDSDSADVAAVLSKMLGNNY